jgi:hypothetical protein
MTTSPVEEKGTKGFGGKSLRLLTQGLEQLKKGQAIVSQRGFRGATMGTHPTVKFHQELRVSRCEFERCSRGDVASRSEKGNQITGAPRELNGVGTRRLQAVMSIEVGLKRLQRLFIEFREGNPGLLGPQR